MTGTTPFPKVDDDPRLPHVAKRATRQIAKTALNAEQTVQFRHFESLTAALEHVRADGYKVAALEQAASSEPLPASVSANWAIIVGNEPNGLHSDELALADEIWEIPMQGAKKSLNVSIAGAIALWQLQQK